MFIHSWPLSLFIVLPGYIILLETYLLAIQPISLTDSLVPPPAPPFEPPALLLLLGLLDVLVNGLDGLVVLGLAASQPLLLPRDVVVTLPDPVESVCHQLELQRYFFPGQVLELLLGHFGVVVQQVGNPLLQSFQLDENHVQTLLTTVSLHTHHLVTLIQLIQLFLQVLQFRLAAPQVFRFETALVGLHPLDHLHDLRVDTVDTASSLHGHIMPLLDLLMLLAQLLQLLPQLGHVVSDLLAHGHVLAHLFGVVQEGVVPFMSVLELALQIRLFLLHLTLYRNVLVQQSHYSCQHVLHILDLVCHLSPDHLFVHVSSLRQFVDLFLLPSMLVPELVCCRSALGQVTRHYFLQSIDFLEIPLDTLQFGHQFIPADKVNKGLSELVMTLLVFLNVLFVQVLRLPLESLVIRLLLLESRGCFSHGLEHSLEFVVVVLVLGLDRLEETSHPVREFALLLDDARVDPGQEFVMILDSPELVGQRCDLVFEQSDLLVVLGLLLHLLLLLVQQLCPLLLRLFHLLSHRPRLLVHRLPQAVLTHLLLLLLFLHVIQVVIRIQHVLVNLSRKNGLRLDHLPELGLLFLDVLVHVIPVVFRLVVEVVDVFDRLLDHSIESSQSLFRLLPRVLLHFFLDLHGQLADTGAVSQFGLDEVGVFLDGLDGLQVALHPVLALLLLLCHPEREQQSHQQQRTRHQDYIIIENKMQALEDREQVELFISCRSLRDMDVMSKSDPVVVLSVRSDKGQWTEWGRTEQIDNNLNPDFSKSFPIDFIFEKQQHIMFQCLDIDGANSYDFIGQVETTLSNVVGARGSMIVLDLMNKSLRCGKIIIRAEKTGTCNDVFSCSPCVSKIESQRWFSDTKPFIRMFKTTEDNQKIKVYESAHMIGTKFNRTAPLNIKMSKLCNDDRHRPITLELWDYHSDGGHKLIGVTKFTVGKVEEQGRQGRVDIPVTKKNKQVGLAHFENARVVYKPSFIEYVRGGTELNLIGAVDFTGSNGVVTSPSSLHFINQRNPQSQNMYQQALMSIGDILVNYDHSKMLPMYGFGGKAIPLGDKTLHCFPMNFNVQEPRVFGLQGIMQCYEKSLNLVQLSGPTLFSPILREVNSVCRQAVNSNKYMILLILTDGAIHDMDETIDMIFQAVDLPLSIIIVGLGDADFSLMETLDGDDGLFDRRGQRCKRDLVQFVPYNKFKGNPSALAKEVLEELPDQLVQYYMAKGIKPGVPVQQDMGNINMNPIDNIHGAAFAMAGGNNFLDNLINQQMPPPPM